MFSYYRNLLTSTIKINSIPEGAGGEDMNALDRMSELNAQQTAQQKLDAARKAISEIEGSDVAILEEAVREVPAEAREEAGKLLLETVVERILSQNPSLRDAGVFEEGGIGNRRGIEFNSNSAFFNTDALSQQDVAILEKYGITQDTLISMLNSYAKIGTGVEYPDVDMNQVVADASYRDAVEQVAKAQEGAPQLDPNVDMNQVVADASYRDAVEQVAKAQEGAPQLDPNVDMTEVAFNSMELRELERVIASAWGLDSIKFSTDVAGNETMTRAVQAALNKLGFDSGNPDGEYGPKTRQAVLAYQQERWATGHDGKAGTETLGILMADLGKQDPDYGNTGNMIAEDTSPLDDTQLSWEPAPLGNVA